MRAKKQLKSARKSGKRGLKSGAVDRIKTLRIAANHNETLVLDL